MLLQVNVSPVQFAYLVICRIQRQSTYCVDQVDISMIHFRFRVHTGSGNAVES